MSKTAKQAKSKTKVTRIKAGEKPVSKTKSSQTSVNTTTKIKTINRASESTPAKTEMIKPQQPLAKNKTKLGKSNKPANSKNPFKRFGRYIKEAFSEIKMVKWPTRKETWKMTFAVLFYSALIIVIVLLLDNLYAWLFKLIIR